MLEIIIWFLNFLKGAVSDKPIDIKLFKIVVGTTASNESSLPIGQS
jgi:hypothetical protein